MTFYDQEGSGPAPERGGEPPDATFGDPDIWSDAPAPDPAPRPAPAASAPAPGQGRTGPRRPRTRTPQAPSGDAPGRGRRRQVPDDDGYFELPPETRMPRWLAAVLVIVLVVGALVGGTWWWYGNQVDPPGGPGDAVSVQIPEGSTTSRVADILATKA